MKPIFLSCFLSLSLFQLSAQIQLSSNTPYKGNTYQIVIVKINADVVRKFMLIENDQKIPHQAFLSSLKKDSSFFLMNTGSSGANCEPIGLYQNQSVQKKAVNLNTGTGNFFMKPNGALLITDKDIIVCESSEIQTHNAIRIGFQSGPMLVHAANINANFGIGSTNKNIRSGVGTFVQNNEKYVVFAISSTPVSFYELAELFSLKFNCAEALCLESVGCAMTFPNITPPNPLFNGVICKYMYLGL